jgi:hypothetical protein
MPQTLLVLVVIARDLQKIKKQCSYICTFPENIISKYAYYTQTKKHFDIRTIGLLFKNGVYLDVFTGDVPLLCRKSRRRETSATTMKQC